ncbi:flagellar biosynthetic protein FliR [Cognatiyoonia sp. IB215182]|uniref:flagellar biosynthetic protein FliR n=1 Tax=Cognatiyoonia sp. IB215182 TaxID=3097353 RepID=UPI002A138D71|nr:flagellar biosynthetic protein FliR [Cognatiyoonia sp. IB215182]MDX8352878.1 flagellar biosynthetic protein FliR [Cognatiyoonia sp. IB215182]
MEALVPLLPLSQEVLWVGFVVFVRVSAVMAVLPAFGDQPVPMRVRLALALMFTFVVAPAVAPTIGPMPDSLLPAAAFLGPEALAGLFFGIFLRFFILILQIAGSVAAQATSLSQIFGGTTGVDPQPAIGHVLVVAGTALAALSGLHVQAAAYMIQSYVMVPYGAGLQANVVLQVGVGEVTRTFGLAFTLAAPFLIASLIYNVILGVINRAMPQLMVSFVGAPAITAGGLFLLLLTAPVILSVWMLAFSEFMQTPFGVWP